MSDFFTEAGWLGRDAVLMTGINAIIYILSTIPTCVVCTWYLFEVFLTFSLLAGTW